MFTEPELTEDQKAVNEVKRFVYESNVSAQALEQNLILCFNMVWNNPNVTAKKFFEILGPEGAKVFSDSWAVQQLVKRFNPNFQYLVPNKSYTIDEATGIVSVTEPEIPKEETK